MCNRPATEAEKNASQHEKLSAAIRRAEKADQRLCDDSRTIIAAARMYLNTLPPPPKVEVKRWAVMISVANNICHATFSTREQAEHEAGHMTNAAIVELTGSYEEPWS